MFLLTSVSCSRLYRYFGYQNVLEWTNLPPIVTQLFMNVCFVEPELVSFPFVIPDLSKLHWWSDGMQWFPALKPYAYMVSEQLIYGFTIWLYGCTDYPAAYPTLLAAEGFSINLALARSYLYHRFVWFLLASPLILLKKSTPKPTSPSHIVCKCLLECPRTLSLLSLPCKPRLGPCLHEQLKNPFRAKYFDKQKVRKLWLMWTGDAGPNIPFPLIEIFR